MAYEGRSELNNGLCIVDLDYIIGYVKQIWITRWVM
jgi:hypothetical protein